MKRHNIIVLLLSVILFGCAKENPENKEQDLKSIEVSYLYNDLAVKSLQFNSSSRSVKVDVKVNNQNVYWNMESDARWCKVLDEKHRGDGSFTLNIIANDEYSDREPANVTFVSGQYRGFAIQVTQTGNVFIVNKLFSVGSKDSGTEEIEVSVKEGVEWDIVDAEWLSAEKEGLAVSSNGVTTTKVLVSWKSNESSSRFGSIGLKRADLDEPDSKFSVFQFGNDMTYNDEGDIILPAQNCPAVRVTVPASGVSAVSLPEWITYSVESNEDNTDTYSLTFADNPSDARTERIPQIIFAVTDKEVDVQLPVMRQEYYSVQGITSADGLKLFASTVNEGGDISEWQKDGKVILLNNIDMSALSSEWTPVGTSEQPFKGVFDGRYRKIMNMRSSSPLFGVCEGATLSNIVIDESSGFSATGEYMTEYVIAPLAGSLTDCTVSECSNYSSVTMGASTLNEATSAYVAGLAGRTYGSTVISESHNYGNVNITSASKTAKGQGKFYVGGVVGANGGTVEQCSNNGTVSDAAVSYYHYLGGVSGINSGIVKDSKNCGVVTLSALRVVDGQSDVSRYVCMGGISGANNEGGEITGCTNDAGLVSASDVKLQRIGGISGYLESSKVSGNVNTENGKCDIKGTSTDQRGVRQLSLGGLYGEFVCDAVLDFNGESEVSVGLLNISEYEYSVDNSIIFVGGIVGRANLTYDLTIKHPQWKSTIAFNVKSNKYGSYVLGVGGVVGGVGVYETSNVSGGHLTVEDAVTEGFINIFANSKYVLAHKYSGIGGVSGFVSTGGATFLRCNSATKIAQPDYCGKSNGYAQHVGGISGLIMGGDSEIRDCHNTGEIDNEHYNNNPWNSTGLQCGSSAGIIGAFAYNNDYKGNMIIAGCTNTASVRSYRGMAGGIAGYLRNADISDCNNTGTMANGNRSYVGGIVGIADNTAISGCTASCKVGGSSAGSEIFSGGGIVGILWAGSSCKSSAYFGDITSLTTTAGETAGSIAGSTSSGTVISGCKFGGSVSGSTVTESNYSSFTSGDSNADISSCTYWNGK